MQKEIYLDNSATTRQYDDVTALMAEVASNKYGNPSSLHTKGIEAEKLVTSARKETADSLGAEPREIYFTSGGTESNNLAIRGYLEANPRKGRHIITTKTEHPSVLEVYHHLEEQGYRVDYIGVGENGLMDIGELREKFTRETSLVSYILVNNETGAIQQMDKIAQIRDEMNPQAVIHADAVQAYGKIRVIPEKSGIGLMSVSSHKIHGPKGVGALYCSRKIRIKPLLYGGGQEALIRSGTENVPGIAGFGLAVRMTFENLETNYEKIADLKKRFIEMLAASEIEHIVNSPEDGSPYVINISFANVRAEVLLHHLEQRNIFVSTGSACSSHKNTRSHVLTAMGVPASMCDGAIRFSLSGFNTQEDIELTVEALKEIIPMIDVNRRYRSGRK